MPESMHNFPEGEPVDHYTFADLLGHQESGFKDIDPQKLAKSSPYEVGAFLERLEVDDRRTLLRKLSEEKAAEILAEMDAADSAEVVGAMRENRAVKILEDLDLDDAADIVSQLKEEDRDRLLQKVKPEIAHAVRKLMTYAPDTAGGVMNPHIPTVRDNLMIDQAIERVRELHQEIDDFYDIYVVDFNKKLKGVIFLRDLLFSDPKKQVKDIMKTDLQGFCYPEQDKETVALTMAEHNLREVPIVDRHGHLLGIVSHDDVLDIIQEEATEDIQKLLGAGPDESIHDRVISSFKKRNPWLFINLITAFTAASVTFHFRNSIERLPLLAVLMTIIGSLGGNTGAQTLAVAIRGLALGEFHPGDAFKICLRETWKGLLNGLLIGAASAIIVFILVWTWQIPLIVFLSLTLNMAFSGLVGACIPLLLYKFKFDPAQSSYIFLTAFTDIGGLLIFLSLGSFFLL